MTKRNLTIVLAAVVVAGLATLVIATSLVGGSNGSMNHSMPNGQMMNDDAMGSSAGTGSHEMSDGESMSDDQMQGGK